MEDRYIDGTYMKHNPNWHVEESAWKVIQINRMLKLHNLSPMSICDIGCGVGEVLKELQPHMDERCILWGYDISPQAIALSASRANERLHFKQGDIRQEAEVSFELLLLLDVIEHIEDYLGFLRAVKSKGEYKLLHIPLDLSAQLVVRRNGLLNVHDTYGHIHYFTKELAHRVLQDAGYEVLDSFYTSRAVEQSTKLVGRRLLNIPRRALFALNQDLAARALGGFSLLVLAS